MHIYSSPLTAGIIIMDLVLPGCFRKALLFGAAVVVMLYYGTRGFRDQRLLLPPHHLSNGTVVLPYHRLRQCGVHHTVVLFALFGLEHEQAAETCARVFTCGMFSHVAAERLMKLERRAHKRRSLVFYMCSTIVVCACVLACA